LSLDDIEVIDIRINSNNEIIIRVKSAKEIINCHQCGKVTEPYGKGRLLKLRHLPILGRQIFIEITPPRGICKACDDHPTTTQTLDWFVRIKELARLRKELSTDEYKSLKEAISILVNNNECVPNKDKIKLEKLFKYSPALKVAYRLARQLTSIFNSHHRKATGEKKINAWIARASKVKCFNGFIETLEKYKNEVTNYFINRNTSGFVEGLNNKIKVIKRRCYGIFNLKHLFQRVFLDLVGYKLFYANQSITSMA